MMTNPDDEIVEAMCEAFDAVYDEELRHVTGDRAGQWFRNLPDAMCNALAAARQLIERQIRAEIDQEILPRPTLSLPWSPHEGPPTMTPEFALKLYRDKRSEALSRTEMTEEQRANFVGDSKPT